MTRQPKDLEDVRGTRWETPPDSVRDRVRRMPQEDRLEEPSPAETVDCLPEDVRAASASLEEGQDVLVTRSHDVADLTVTVHPPEEDGHWTLDGRVWLREPGDAPIRVALVHGDHVLQTTTVADGEYFELSEVLPPRWHLEVHLPGAICLRVDDPRA